MTKVPVVVGLGVSKMKMPPLLIGLVAVAAIGPSAGERWCVCHVDLTFGEIGLQTNTTLDCITKQSSL
ncbi:hypothetical protein FFI89_029035 [Bradyrhizobium sp. KBS0727]|uniref:hypothetical protein n=1 Tax=unclassified Bradyrhizobium TaxID=2631580 RepID=UPI00110DD163|nr:MULTISPECIES: hypothetical protein [unclassified Bradyrhizobium]QDW40815.1 hypothetical protein FFI71_029040 [Bradyrhizobium sp. KBS0725]QDW47421.1 hypothetical protein FFI89_029035 [Bradyrhizobium sp. KBS0727]